MEINKFQKECPICGKILKSSIHSLTSFEQLFEKHLKKHKLLQEVKK